MPVSNWDETSASGRRRVYMIEINRQLGQPTVCRFHLERVFVDANDLPLAKAPCGSWDLLLEDAINDTELAPYIMSAAGGLEGLSEILYARSVAAANPPPTISDFQANPASITVGESSTLSWAVSDATSLSINHGVGDVLALTEAVVSPTTTTTYTITAVNANGTTTQEVTVTVA